jgi:conserved repeat domain
MAPIVFLAYSSLTSAPVVDSQIAFERTVTPNRTYAGEIITVKLTVSNHGDRPIPDLRIVDGVPDELAVVDGSTTGGAHTSK